MLVAYHLTLPDGPHPVEQLSDHVEDEVGDAAATKTEGGVPPFLTKGVRHGCAYKTT